VTTLSEKPLYRHQNRTSHDEDAQLNGIGLMSIVLLAVGSCLLPLGVLTDNTMLSVLAVPFAVAGGLGLSDDLVMQNRISKKVLGLE
jgi:hypothetical protein